MDRRQELARLLQQFGLLGIGRQIDYNKFCLYSIITHSTAIEGSTVTEVENQMLFDHRISAGGHTLVEQYMNLDLKAAYERCMELAAAGTDITGEMLPAVKGKEKSREKIVRLLGENPNMTTVTLAEAIGISPKGVERHLANLKRKGVIIRIGPDKGGHWEVVGGCLS